jgi:hypothetical protein
MGGGVKNCRVGRVCGEPHHTHDLHDGSSHLHPSANNLEYRVLLV